MSYKDAGVDISAGEAAVNRIKTMVRRTFTPNVMTDLGKFGGFYQLDLSGYDKPVLVSSIDGVGTKLKVAFMMDRHDTIGEDLVNHCINDILVGGARPMYFLDYIGTGTLSPDVMEAIITGMVRGCEKAGCALIGGEMAEMPGFYSAGEYDVAGSITGIVEKDKVIDGSKIEAGNVLIGLPSSGLHTNGYSLARKVLFEHAGYSVNDTPEVLGGVAIGEALLAVHRCYLPVVDPLLDKIDILGMSHVTGGGLIGNTQRILPDGLDLAVDWNAWATPPIFKLIKEKGNVSILEMRKSFNMGIGYIFIISPAESMNLMNILIEMDEDPIMIGHVR
ncbi:phosphoribosylformylglycinamidine cyclo-ligase [bacterium]|nr:phosphoribosylformylglycinamidine cyclo-ligase [bacterium]